MLFLSGLQAVIYFVVGGTLERLTMTNASAQPINCISFAFFYCVHLLHLLSDLNLWCAWALNLHAGGNLAAIDDNPRFRMLHIQDAVIFVWGRIVLYFRRLFALLYDADCSSEIELSE